MFSTSAMQTSADFSSMASIFGLTCQRLPFGNPNALQ